MTRPNRLDRRRRRVLRRQFRRALAAAVAIGVFGGGAPARAAAAAPAAIGSSLSVATDPEGAATQVVGNARGDTTAVWRERADGITRLLGSTRPAGGAWGAPEEITQTPTGTTPEAFEPIPKRLVVDPAGTSYLLWQSAARASGAPRSLQVAVRPAGGRWSHDASIAEVAAPPGIGYSSDLAITSDGTLIVLWTSSTTVPTIFTDKTPPGITYVTERSPAGVWGAPQPLGPADGVSSDPRLAVNNVGAAVAVWSVGDRFGDAALSVSARSAAGTWTSVAAAKNQDAGGYGYSDPRLDDIGRTHLVLANAGNYGIASLSHVLSNAGALSNPVNLPTPSRRQSLKEWLGSGYVHAWDTALDAKGQLVVAYGGESHDVESGGFGTGALWAAARDASGKWNIVPLDGLGESTGAMNVDLSTDPTGNVVATWAATSGQGSACQSILYRSVRNATGAWSRRVVVGTAGNGTAPDDAGSADKFCQPVTVQSTGGAGPVLWWGEANRLLVVDSVAPVSTAAPTLAAVAVSRTWAEVRHAGGIMFRCQSTAAGFCSASVVRASSRRKGKSKARALACLSLRGADPVVAGEGGSAVTLPWNSYCGSGWVPPTMSFSVLITVDVPGQPAAARRITVKLRR